MEILILAVIAAFVIYRLYNVLGHVDEFENISKEIKHEIRDITDITSCETLPSQDIDGKFNNFASEITNIKLIDKNFLENNFLKAAELAYGLILDAYSQSDLETLHNLLTEKVYNQFEKDINNRKAKNHILQKTLVSIEDIKIENVELKQNKAYIRVEFTSQQINIIKNTLGKVVDGDPSVIDHVTDIWTFSRNLTEENPTWYLEKTSTK